MSAATSPFRVATRADGVAVVTYDVPGESTNTLRADFAEHFLALIDQIEADPAVRAAVLVSGKDSFIVGADVGMLSAVTTRAEGEALCRNGHHAIDRFAAMTKPVVAAVHGQALGGGFEVALACRGRVASDDPKTSFGLPEVQLGLLPGLHGLQRLAALVGFQVALDHGLTGKTLRAKKAASLGVVAEVVPRSILVDVAAAHALALADGDGDRKKRKKAKKSAKLADLALETNPLGHKVLFGQARKQLHAKTRGNYPATDRIVEVLETLARRGWEASCEAEVAAFADLLVTTTSRRLREIFFATTALKKDTGVDDPAVKRLPVDKIGVIGAGLMGAGIAYVSAEAGIEVRLRDRDEASVARGLKTVADLFDQRVKRKSLSRLERDRKLGLVTGTTDASGMKSAALVVEAVFEDLALKHRILADVEENGRTDVIFASNTSSIPIARIAAAATLPERVIGMHYFSPVPKMPLLEVIRTEQTAPEVVATAVAVGKRQGKTVIVVKDGVGFYTSRILAPYMNEASWILTEGASVEQIDEAMLDWGFPVGPIALLDEVGIDVAAHVGPIMLEAFGERIEAPPSATKLVADDRKGRKNGRGFYLYGEARKGPAGPLSLKSLGKNLLGKLGGRKGKAVDASVYGVLGLPVPEAGAKPKVAREEIQMRCALQFVNEALHCLGEGILRSPRDGDVGAIFGLGFPPFRGGPFRYVDDVGPEEVLRRVRQYEARFGKRWAPAPLLIELAASGRPLYPV